MFKKTNKQLIKFKAIDDNVFNVFDPPVPAKKILPEWYKKQDRLTTPGQFSMGDNGNPNHTIKACMPIFDVISAGYIFKLPADIHFINDKNGGISTQWSTNNIRPIESHPTTQYSEYTVPDGYNPTAFKFIQPWKIETPTGYSCLFIQPALRDDLPFQVIPAIVDTDKHPIKVNFPFFIKEDFDGILPMGTPIMQIIPFKREEWIHEVVEDLSQESNKKWISAERKIGNRYKSFFRTIKKWD